MIIENEGKSKKGLYITIGSIVAAILIIAGFAIYFNSISHKNGSFDNTEVEQIKQVIKDYRIPVDGVSSVDKDGNVTVDDKAAQNVTQEQISGAIKTVNSAVSNRDKFFTPRTSSYKGFDKLNYYKERTQTKTDVIDKIISEEADDSIEEKVQTVIMVQMTDLKERLNKTALIDRFKVTNEGKANNCGRGEFQETQAEDGKTAGPVDCGIEVIEDKEYLGDEYSARILGGIIRAYADGTLDSLTGIDNLTQRQMIPTVCYWLEKTNYPDAYFWRETNEGNMFKGIITYGYWESLDFTKMENVVVKESNKRINDFFDEKYTAAFSIDNRWYKASLVEKDMDLYVYDIVEV